MADSKETPKHARITSNQNPKRIVVGCDGSWMNAAGKDGDKPPSNVTRMMRALKNTFSDGKPQVLMYHDGVGSSGRLLDSTIGGTFGLGLDQDIRDLYSFGRLIGSLGLLTVEGFEHFADIFEDYENMGSKHRDNSEYLYSGLKPYQGETGKARVAWETERMAQYCQWLKKEGYTRDKYLDSDTEIRIKAIGVWDTVGSLVSHAFQALALDEPRAGFLPALWERAPDNKHTQLRQVWFSGSHGNAGGGWPDQEVATITLAWMTDQLAALGLEIDGARMSALFADAKAFAAAHPFPHVPGNFLQDAFAPREVLPWAAPPVCPADTPRQRDAVDCPGKGRHPHPTATGAVTAGRPWGLGQTRYPSSALQVAAGTTVRRPGLFLRVDPEDNEETDEPLLRIDERVHASVRVRLACGGLGMDDKEVWRWRRRRECGTDLPLLD